MTRSRIVASIAAPLGLCVVAAFLLWFLTRPVPAAGVPAGGGTGGSAWLRIYMGAQNQFHRSHRYDSGDRRFANPTDGAGFPDLYYLAAPGDGNSQLALVPKGFADATGPASAHQGFYFVDITSGPGGEYDFRENCGLCAVPSPYRSGRLTFIVELTGIVWQKDNGGRPVTQFPSSPDAEGWTIPGN